MKTKTISSVLAAVLTAGSFASIPAFAEDDPIVYTYTNEAGESVDVTQSELDAGHWNADLLGGRAHVVYEDFPVIMNPFVDDFANLSLEVRYLKDTGAFDDVQFTITDMYTNEIVYNYDLTDGMICTDDLAIGGYYKLKISESFAGENLATYTKYITTSYETADMPDYVTDPGSGAINYISIVDTEKIAEATSVDEYGREIFDADIAAYNNIPENEWEAYRTGLENNKLYKIAAGSETDPSIGFISTYTWGNNLGVFYPTYTIYSEDISSVPAATAFDPINLKDSAIMSSQAFDSYGDLLFNSPYSYYISFQYTLRGNDALNDVFSLKIHSNDSFSYLIWYKKKNSSAIVRNYDTKTARTGTVNLDMIAEFDDQVLDIGDTMYFIIYRTNITGISGSICIENKYYDDDVTGSAYDQYLKGNSISFANYNTMGSYDQAKEQYAKTYEITDIWDIDTFYLNNTASSDSGYTFYFLNKGNDTDNGGMTMTLCLNYVDFYDDDHFVLKRQAGTSAKYNIEKGLNFSPKNNQTKYFLQVMSSANDPNKDCYYDKYEFYTVFYPET